MGQEDFGFVARLSSQFSPPAPDQIEVNVFGPGYGECVLVHIGNGQWIVVDSCLGTDRRPAALEYLEKLGTNPSDNVRLIVATHWHDDHIKGIAELVRVCDKAVFCCAAALREEEFLSLVAALEKRPATPAGSGLRELYNAFTTLSRRSATCSYAIANRLIFNQNACRIWSLSPSDATYNTFIQRLNLIVPTTTEAKRRIPSLTPNDASVVLLIELDGASILLGADLERRGWVEILKDYNQPTCKPSVFKVPHHGSVDAHVDQVWEDILVKLPIAVLTPWRRGRGSLPTSTDVDRIVSFTERSYISASNSGAAGRSPRHRNSAVARTIRETGANIRPIGTTGGMLRLRKRLSSTDEWNIELFGSACKLVDFKHPLLNNP